MTNGKLRVGLIGAGSVGRGEHLPAWAALPFADVVAVADPSSVAIGQAVAKFPIRDTFSDWRKLLQVDDLDVVDVCTPNVFHAPISLAALRRGLHVLCEKPLAATAAEVVQLRDEAAKAGRVLMTGQNLHFSPTARGIKGLIDAGQLGDVYFARGRWLRRRKVPPQVTFTDKSLSGGGPLLDVGCNALDLAYWFLGCPEPVAVSATAGKYLADREDLSGELGEWDRSRFDVEDFGAAFVRFAGGAVVTLEASWLAFLATDEWIQVRCFGRKGGCVWPDGLIVGETEKMPWTLKMDVPEGDGGSYGAEIKAFAEAVRAGGPSPVPVEQTLAVTRVLEACYESARTGCEVRL